MKKKNNNNPEISNLIRLHHNALRWNEICVSM